jgi:hypothetical protein
LLTAVFFAVPFLATVFFAAAFFAVVFFEGAFAAAAFSAAGAAVPGPAGFATVFLRGVVFLVVWAMSILVALANPIGAKIGFTQESNLIRLSA